MNKWLIPISCYISHQESRKRKNTIWRFITSFELFFYHKSRLHQPCISITRVQCIRKVPQCWAKKLALNSFLNSFWPVEHNLSRSTCLCTLNLKGNTSPKLSCSDSCDLQLDHELVKQLRMNGLAWNSLALLLVVPLCTMLQAVLSIRLRKSMNLTSELIEWQFRVFYIRDGHLENWFEEIV